MAFDYATNVTAVYQALADYNTTTASPDLSANLTTRVKNVYKNDPGIVGLRADIYPAVFVRINSSSKEFGELGATGPTKQRKFADVTYDVIGFYRKDGALETTQNVLVELERLARNIEGVFEAELTLSGTALWCNTAETNFYGPFANDEMWLKACVVTLNARYHYR